MSKQTTPALEIRTLLDDNVYPKSTEWDFRQRSENMTPTKQVGVFMFKIRRE